MNQSAQEQFSQKTIDLSKQHLEEATTQFTKLSQELRQVELTLDQLTKATSGPLIQRSGVKLLGTHAIQSDFFDNLVVLVPKML